MQMIRPATQRDLETICHIHADTWQATYKGLLPEHILANIKYSRWIPIFEQTLQNSEVQVLLSLLNRKPSGVISYGKPRQEAEPGYGEIYAIYVLPQYWQMKQGYKLVQFALAGLRQQGYSHCYLWVLRENERARRFYERLGFAADGQEIQVELEDYTMTELRYSRPL